jgi:carbamoyl-phosphate synthase large subunit
MPKRTDLKRLLLLGSGPIVIGQACEFDYSGTQACKALLEEGYEVILVNSNPATIMTDPETATRVYIEPLEVPWLEKIIERERPQALIPTLGGQTALNAAIKLHEAGVLKKYNVELLGASIEAINKAEDRQIFKTIMGEIGASVPKSFSVHNAEEGALAAREIGFPLILRPSFTMGGTGGGIAYTQNEYESLLSLGLRESPTKEVLVEQSVLGWKEFELEVMRDNRGTFVVVCSIENFDPMGVHTGDSITVAPALTLTDREYQDMRDEARKVIDAIGVTTGGANIQFAVNPKTGERIVIEMNPRVSRSSALASKATGFPIAKLAAKLAVGFELHEILNDITKSTPSSFEPSIDYIVTKIPRFDFAKFAGVKDSLTTQMKSIGEVMAIGRTFKESLQKALASLETGSGGLDEVIFDEEKLIKPNSRRIFYVAQAMREGYSLEKIATLTGITPWFLDQIRQIVNAENELKANEAEGTNHSRVTNFLQDSQTIRRYKKLGFSDKRLANILNKTEKDLRAARHTLNIRPGFWSVDTCAGEFESRTPYFYSTYHTQSSTLNLPTSVVVLGSGPNRIGQAIEFDYGCVQGIKALKKNGLKAVMINSNPETVSTDYDTSDCLFFEPLTAEHVIEVLDFVKPQGVCVQLGGQTPINLASEIVKHGHKIIGSPLGTLEIAEDREKFSHICRAVGLVLPKHRTATTKVEALESALEIQFPIICRPSFVLGGRRMEILGDMQELENYLNRYKDLMSDDSPLLIDEFLEDALEVDVDIVSDGREILIGGIVEHIEGAGVHSGDSMGVLPPQRLPTRIIDDIEGISRELCQALKIVGHLNLQLAIKGDKVYVLEANPRSSRSVPFVSKATGIPIVRLAMECMLGQRLHVTKYWRNTEVISVKGVVFPFKKFPESDILLGPEMRSTGESMGRSCNSSYAEALQKAFVSSGFQIPAKGSSVFVSVREKDKVACINLAKRLIDAGFKMLATEGTAVFLNKNNLKCETINKVRQGHPHCVDLIQSGGIQLVINTTSGAQSISDSFSIRRSSVERNIPCLTEISVADAFVQVLTQSEQSSKISISPLS